MLVLFVAFASPYWMLYQINQALENNQADQIAQYIDFPAVIASLKPQVEAIIAEKTGLNDQHHPWAKWGLKLSKKIADQAVDATINSETIALLMQGKALKESISISEIAGLSGLLSSQNDDQTSLAQASNLKLQKLSASQHSTTLSAEQTNSHKTQWHSQYLNWNTFAVNAERGSGNMTQFIFKRNQLSWKMKQIQLNDHLF